MAEAKPPQPQSKNVRLFESTKATAAEIEQWIDDRIQTGCDVGVTVWGLSILCIAYPTGKSHKFNPTQRPGLPEASA